MPIALYAAKAVSTVVSYRPTFERVVNVHHSAIDGILLADLLSQGVCGRKVLLRRKFAIALTARATCANVALAPDTEAFHAADMLAAAQLNGNAACVHILFTERASTYNASDVGWQLGSVEPR